MSYKNFYFSRFSHWFSRNDMIAWFHALKMKPLFLDPLLREKVFEVISGGKPYSEADIQSLDDGRSILRVIELLLENRVLNDFSNRDDEVIKGFRSSIPGPQVRIAYFVLAESCNLACKYCFEKAPSHSQKKLLMSEATALKSINFFEKMLTLYPSENEEKDIIFYGGEPLLNYKVLLFILREIRNRRDSGSPLWKKMRLSMVTNGVLLSEEKLKELCNLGLGIGISIDGPEKINDANRVYTNGNGSFKGAKRAIDLCKNKGVGFSLSITLSESAIKNYSEVLKFIAEVSPSSIGFNILLGGKDSPPFHGYNEAAAIFLIDAFKEFRKKGLYEDRMMRKVKAFSESQVYPFDCGATGGNQVIFSPNGQVGVCHGYLADKKHFPTTVDQLDFLPQSDPTFLEWARRSPLGIEACQTCPALGICGGGCPMNAEKNLGTIFDLDERFCVHAKKTLEWLVWDLFENAENDNGTPKKD